jgi:phosphate transport system permease protein
MAWSLDQSGEVSVHDLDKAKIVESFPLRPEVSATIIGIHTGFDNVSTLTWSDKIVTRVDLGFKPIFDQESRRSIKLKSNTPTTHTYKSSMALVHSFSRLNEEGAVLFVGLTSNGKIVGQKIVQEEDFLGNINEEVSELSFPMNKVSHIGANSSGTTVFALTEKGELAFWGLSFGLKKKGSLQLDLDGRKVTAMRSLIGTDEVAIGFSSGEVEVVALASHEGGTLEPTLIHSYVVSESSIQEIHPSPRDRTLFIKTSAGELVAWYSTNQRTLYEEMVDMRDWHMSVAPRGKGVTLWSDGGKLQVSEWYSPHPEGGWRAFFQEIWYTGYPEADYVWQSSSGSDDFEPKISLIPLIFGTIKGAFYAMIFSAPLAVLAALYTSVFAGKKVKGVIKPVVEMMSAVPSVVVGFLGALWLAPIIDDHLLSIAIAIPLTLLMLLALPLFFGRGSGKDPLLNRPQLILILATVVIFVAGYSSSLIAEGLESQGAFGGNFRTWLLEGVLAGNYDMRNSLLISITLGFAVIPIIYSISEDALSSVPKGLTSASLALGATPWQTAWNVVLPTASPGIFAAMTLGLGRAVGETMIVLMATGNTPIMDVNIFEGFRALSANIAVEMPEAPAGGTLYRTLFLSAAVLLLFTSVLNMITEIVRHRLAKNYSKL